VTIDEWLDAAAVSAREIAGGTLGASQLVWDGPSKAALPGDLWGVYIPLLTDAFALQLGVLGTRDVCASLARALLGDMDGDSVSSDEDVFDAVGEVTNLIAGNVKMLLSDKVNIRVGVPLAMRGRVFPLGSSQSSHGSLAVDQQDVWLVMTGTAMR
jgi:hypothetical protein